MANYLNCVISHGALAESIKAVVEKLAAPSPTFYCFTNQDFTLEKIEASIEQLILEKNPEQTILFVDLMGGSCWILANRLKHRFENMVILSGVNVPMLISYSINMDRLPFESLTSKIMEDARKGIVRK